MVWCKAIIPLKILLFFCLIVYIVFCRNCCTRLGLSLIKSTLLWQPTWTYSYMKPYWRLNYQKIQQKNPIKKNPLNLIHTFVHLVQKCVRKFPNFEFCCLNSFFALVIIINFIFFCLTLFFFCLDNYVNNNFM